jgi:hypothetical protein
MNRNKISVLLYGFNKCSVAALRANIGEPSSPFEYIPGPAKPSI